MNKKSWVEKWPILTLLGLSLEILLPVNVLLNAFWGYYPSLLQLLIGFFIMGGSLLIVFFCAYWEYTSVYLRYVYLGLFLIAILTTIPPTVSVTLFPQAIPVKDPKDSFIKRAIINIAGAGMGLMMNRPLEQIRKRVDLPPMGPTGITSQTLNLIPLSPQIVPPNPL